MGDVTDSPPPPQQWSYLMDMDGVLVHEEHMIPGADVFIAELTAQRASLEEAYMKLTDDAVEYRTATS